MTAWLVLSDAIHTPNVLLDYCRIPRQVEIDDRGCALEVQAGASGVGGEKDADRRNRMGVVRSLFSTLRLQERINVAIPGLIPSLMRKIIFSPGIISLPGPEMGA